MSKNRNRAKLNKAKTSNEYNKILLNIIYPTYWDEGLIFFPRLKRGYKNPTKTILKYQVRAYRSWKYNRKTKWK